MNATVKIPISLIRGGTFYWIQEKARLIHPRAWDLQRRLPLALAVAWVPLVVLATVHGGFDDVRALLADYGVYARVFVGIPLLILGQISMETRFRETAQHFLDANIVRFEELSRFRAIMQRTRRLRDAKLPELIVIFIVVIQAAYFLQTGRIGMRVWAVDAATMSLTPAGYYSVFVTQALFLGLLLIALWKWAIWVYVLWRISRLNLRLDATNGVLAGGLGFLGEVPRAFVPVVVAISTVVGGNWRAQVLRGSLTLDDLHLAGAVLAVVIVLIFFLPLAVFSPALLREKRASTLTYGSLQHLLSLQFREKWTTHRNEHVGELLGTPDVSSLADASTGFLNVERMTVYPFRRGVVVAFLAALVVPTIPVVTTQIPLKEIARQLFDAIR